MAQVNLGKQDTSHGHPFVSGDGSHHFGTTNMERNQKRSVHRETLLTQTKRLRPVQPEKYPYYIFGVNLQPHLVVTTVYCLFHRLPGGGASFAFTQLALSLSEKYSLSIIIKYYYKVLL